MHDLVTESALVFQPLLRVERVVASITDCQQDREHDRFAEFFQTVVNGNLPSGMYTFLLTYNVNMG